MMRDTARHFATNLILSRVGREVVVLNFILPPAERFDARLNNRPPRLAPGGPACG
jgi:hypothetical protein